ncbi:unnamed protein product [Paramecium primaurelia]|uniref:Uncharacterized protein n=1 Tax=Paramecium primaurelia TaxID=5886 RepID=A0A8S1NNK7_PARPR|nr:unnamed protein product [Paramecium primaurelia]
MQYFQILKPEIGISITRGILKGVVLIIIGKTILSYHPFDFQSDYPEYFARIPYKHPINPPIYAPHKMEEPEDREKYEKLFDDIIQISNNNREYYMFKHLYHPSLEDGFIIKEALWESDGERVLDEIRGEVRRQLRQAQNLELQNQFHITQRKVLFSKLNGQIRPSI